MNIYLTIITLLIFSHIHGSEEHIQHSSSVSEEDTVNSFLSQFQKWGDAYLEAQAVQLESTQAIENYIHLTTNQYRESLEKQALQYSEDIAALALEHSQNMARGTVPFGHAGVDERFENMHVILHATGYAENVAYNVGSEAAAWVAIDGWIKSDGHRKNLEGNYTLTGIGVAQDSEGGYYFTQLFAKQPFSLD